MSNIAVLVLLWLVHVGGLEFNWKWMLIRKQQDEYAGCMQTDTEALCGLHMPQHPYMSFLKALFTKIFHDTEKIQTHKTLLV